VQIENESDSTPDGMRRRPWRIHGRAAYTAPVAMSPKSEPRSTLADAVLRNSGVEIGSAASTRRLI
jgi:hypothetical protein